MASISICGYIGSIEPIRTTESGSVVLNFTVADSEFIATRDKNPPAQWYSCEVWDEEAERYSEWFYKGFRVSVHGQLVQKPYQKRDGSSGVAIEIRKCRVSVLEKRDERESQETQSYNTRPSYNNQYNNQNNGAVLVPDDDFCPF